MRPSIHLRASSPTSVAFFKSATVTPVWLTALNSSSSNKRHVVSALLGLYKDRIIDDVGLKDCLLRLIQLAKEGSKLGCALQYLIAMEQETLRGQLQDFFIEHNSGLTPQKFKADPFDADPTELKTSLEKKINDCGTERTELQTILREVLAQIDTKTIGWRKHLITLLTAIKGAIESGVVKKITGGDHGRFSTALTESIELVSNPDKSTSKVTAKCMAKLLSLAMIEAPYDEEDLLVAAIQNWVKERRGNTLLALLRATHTDEELNTWCNDKENKDIKVLLDSGRVSLSPDDDRKISFLKRLGSCVKKISSLSRVQDLEKSYKGILEKKEAAQGEVIQFLKSDASTKSHSSFSDLIRLMPITGELEESIGNYRVNCDFLKIEQLLGESLTEEQKELLRRRGRRGDENAGFRTDLINLLTKKDAKSIMIAHKKFCEDRISELKEKHLLDLKEHKEEYLKKLNARVEKHKAPENVKKEADEAIDHAAMQIQKIYLDYPKRKNKNTIDIKKVVASWIDNDETSIEGLRMWQIEEYNDAMDKKRFLERCWSHKSSFDELIMRKKSPTILTRSAIVKEIAEILNTIDFSNIAPAAKKTHLQYDRNRFLDDLISYCRDYHKMSDGDVIEDDAKIFSLYRRVRNVEMAKLLSESTHSDSESFGQCMQAIKADWKSGIWKSGTAVPAVDFISDLRDFNDKQHTVLLHNKKLYFYHSEGGWLTDLVKVKCKDVTNNKLAEAVHNLILDGFQDFQYQTESFRKEIWGYSKDGSNSRSQYDSKRWESFKEIISNKFLLKWGEEDYYSLNAVRVREKIVAENQKFIETNKALAQRLYKSLGFSINVIIGQDKITNTEIGKVKQSIEEFKKNGSDELLKIQMADLNDFKQAHSGHLMATKLRKNTETKSDINSFFEVFPKRILDHAKAARSKSYRRHSRLATELDQTIYRFLETEAIDVNIFLHTSVSAVTKAFQDYDEILSSRWKRTGWSCMDAKYDILKKMIDGINPAVDGGLSPKDIIDKIESSKSKLNGKLRGLLDNAQREVEKIAEEELLCKETELFSKSLEGELDVVGDGQLARINLATKMQAKMKEYLEDSAYTNSIGDWKSKVLNLGVNRFKDKVTPESSYLHQDELGIYAKLLSVNIDLVISDKVKKSYTGESANVTLKIHNEKNHFYYKNPTDTSGDGRCGITSILQALYYTVKDDAVAQESLSDFGREMFELVKTTIAEIDLKKRTQYNSPTSTQKSSGSKQAELIISQGILAKSAPMLPCNFLRHGPGFRCSR